MERVDYTNRIPSNRKNVEYANTRVPENYDRNQIARHQLNVAKNKLVDFDRNYTGIAAFADKLGNFYNKRKIVKLKVKKGFNKDSFTLNKQKLMKKLNIQYSIKKLKKDCISISKNIF